MYLLAFLGICAHVLFMYANSLTLKQQLDWKQSFLWSILALIIVEVFVFLREDIGGMLGVEITKATVFFIGYFSDSLVKNLSKFNPFPDKA